MREEFAHAKDFLSPRQLVALYAGLLGFGSVIIATWHLPEQLLFTLVAPIILVAFRYPRWVYLTVLVIAGCLAVWTTSQTLPNTIAPPLTMLAILVLVAALAELIHRLAAGRLQVEQQLRDSESRLSLIYNSVSDLIFLVRVQAADCFQYVSANDAYLRAYGLTEAHLVGKRIEQILPSAHATFILFKCREALRTHQIIRYEENIALPASRMITETTLTPIFDARGTCTHLLGASRDITERKQAEDALRTSEQYARKIIDSSLDMIVTVDNERRIVEFNTAAEKNFGYPRAQVLGKHINILYADIQAGQTIHRTAFNQGVVKGEVWNKRQSGETFPSYLSASTMRGAQGELLGVVGVSRDITEQKRREDALRESEARNRAILDALPDLMFILDAHGVYLDYHADRRALLMPPEKFLGKNVRDVMPPATAEQILAAMTRARETGAPQLLDYPLPTPTGMRHYELRLVAYADTRLLAVARDITETKQAADALRESAAKYRQLLGSIRTPALALTDTLQILYCNHAYAESVGRTVADLESHALLDLFPAFADTPLHAAYRRVIASGKDEEIESDVKNRVMHTRIFRAPGGLLSLTEDVTARRRFEQAIVRRDAILEAVSFAAERFLRAPAWHTWIQDILARLGEATQVSRVYIFENYVSPTAELFWRQRYEWCAPNITPQIDNPELQDLPALAAGFERWATTLARDALIVGLVRQFPASERAILAAQDIQSIAIVPIWVENTWWGFIGLDDCTQEREWLAAEAEALRTAAAALGAAIARQRTEQAERDQRAFAEALRDVSAALNSTLQFDQVLDHILAQLGRVVPHEAANIMLLDAEKQFARVVRSHGYEAHGVAQTVAELQFAVADMPYFRQAVATGATFVVSDTHTDPQWVSVPASSWVQSYACTPIRVKAQVVGFLNLDGATPGFFNATHVERLRAFADQAALAVENARLFAESQSRAEQLETVNTIGLAINSGLNIEQVVRTLYEQCTQVVAMDAFSVALYDRDTGMIRFPLFLDRGQPRTLGPFNIQAQPGLTGHVVQQRRTLYLPDTLDPVSPLAAQRLRVGGEPTRAYIGVPLIVRDQVIGVLSIQSYQPHAFGEDHLRLLETLATQAAVAIENARLFDEVQRRAERMRVLNEIGQALASTLRLDQLYRLVFQQTQRVLAVDAFYIALYTEAHNVIDFPFNFSDGQEGMSSTLPLGQGPTSRVIRTRQSLFVNQTRDTARSSTPFSGQRRPPASALHVPMLVGDRVIGVISAQSYEENIYTSEDVQVLQTIATQAAVAIENARLYDEVHQLAVTDELTGMFNRRGLFQFGQREFERALRFQRPLAAIMLDIDFFKRINDTYGHPIGDRVLRALAECCRDNLRTIDVIGRYGGEEFFILLPETDLEGALLVAERLRQSISQATVNFGREQLHVTVSLGVTALTPESPNLAALIERADQAEYQAKQAGRDRVVGK